MAVDYSGCTCGANASAVDPCCSPSTSTEQFCLADGSTILAVYQAPCGGCGDAAVPPTLTGYMDPATGVFTAGPLPAGAGKCPCSDTSTLLLCDVPVDGDPAPTVTDRDPTPYFPYPTGAPVAGGQTLWDGGTLDLPPGAGPQPGTTGSVNILAATVQAPRPACDTGTARITVSVNIQQTGPDDGCGPTGHLRLFNGTTQAALTVLPANTPAGYFDTVIVEADVPAADLAAGSIAVALALDAYDDSGGVCPGVRHTGWQLSAFTASTAYDQAGCDTQFLRSVVTDCETGQVQSVTDTTLDGQPYTVTGEPGQCTATGSACCDEQPCRTTSTLVLCDSTPQPIDETTATNTAPTALHQWVTNLTWDTPVDGQPLWDGGSVELPASTTSGPNGTFRATGATLAIDEPCCASEMVSLTVQTRVTNDGPTAGQGSVGGVYLFNGPTQVAVKGVSANFGVGASETAVLGPVDVPLADLLAGRIMYAVGLETNQNGFARSWTLDQFQVTAVAGGVPGCGTQFLRTLVHDCVTGDLIETVDTDLAGAPYAPVQPVGTCQPGTPCTPADPDCQTEQLCDVQQDVPAVLPSVGVPTESWQNLPNGVRWMRRGADGAAPGGWYGADIFTPERFDFDRPVSLTYNVRFSGPTAAPLRIPAGWYLDGLNTGQHAWNATTRTISPTASATQAGVSTFRIDAQTAQTMIAPTVVGTQPSGQTSQYGQITATADVVTLFLRTLCRDGNGAVTATDTALDGITPYTVLGAAGRCTETPPPPCRNCETLVLCDDGAATDTIPEGAGSGTLSNGVAWSTASTQVDFSDTTDGWFLLEDPSTVTFSPSALVQFQLASNGPCVTLPAGVEVVELAPGHTYNPATRQFCASTADVSQRSTFRTDGEVASLALASPPTGDANAFMGGFAVTVQHEGATFLRTVCRNCDGIVTSTTDTTLDGESYTVTGEPGQCAAACDEKPCSNTSSLLVCDLPAGGEPDPTVTDTSPTPYETQGGTEPLAGGAAALWSGGTLTIPADTAPPPDGSPQFLRTVAATVQAPRPGCDTGTATVTTTLRAERTGPDAGCLGTAFVQLLVDGTVVVGDSVVLSTPVGHVEVLTLTAQVPAADLAAGNVALYGAWETYHRSPASCPGSNPDGAAIGGWVLDQFSTDVVYDQAGCETQILANVITNCETGQVESVEYTTTDGQPYTPTGEIGQCTPVSGPTCTKQIVERCGCDDTDGDGIGDVTYTELWAVDPCDGAPPELVGTYRDGDFTQPYTPVAPVECTAGEPIEADPILLCDSGTPFLRHVRYDGNGIPLGVTDTAIDGTTPYTVTGTVGTCAPAPVADAAVHTGVQRLAADTAVSYGAVYPGLQSVTMTVVSGTGLATMTNGTNVSIPAGASITWSVTDTDDSSLDVATIGAAAGGDVLVNWTYKDADAG